LSTCKTIPLSIQQP